MKRGTALLLLLWMFFTGHIVLGQTSEDVCLGVYHEQFPSYQAATTIDPPNISFLGDAAVVLEYASVYDVHVAPDTINYPNIRIQPGGFDTDQILTDLETVILPDNYDFVLLYTLHEVPGWINSGSRNSPPAKNIGLANSGYGGSWLPENWPKLRSVPHMNSVEFLDRPIPPDLLNYGSTLTAFHEIDHYWGVFITAQNSVGPREWKSGEHPLAWLASCCSHWSWVWEEEGMPGIMFSGPTSTTFNEFDLYFMGLMDYEEASQAVYELYEYPRTDPPVLHEITLDSLIYALSLAGDLVYEGDGKRFPATDLSIQNLRVLVVVVKGEDEVFTEDQQQLLIKLVEDIPEDWEVATWGRSSMSVGVDAKSVQPPAKVVQIEPVDGAPDQPLIVSFTWEAQTSATYYLQVSTTSDFTSLVYEDSTLTQTSVTVGPLANNTEHFWRVRAKNAGGIGPWSDVRNFTVAVGTAIEQVANLLPDRYFLYPNYPNPFNPITTIRFDLPEPSNVELTIYDLTGRIVAELVSGSLTAGTYQVSWNADGQASGMYIYHLRTGHFSHSKILILLK